MTRQVFFKAVQDVLAIIDPIVTTPEDVTNIMRAVQIVLQQEKKIGQGVGF